MKNQTLFDRFLSIRKHTENICIQLNNEDYSVQPEIFVSPPKWHLAHSTWFFEQFVLSEFEENYKVFDEDFSFLFNSYYNPDTGDVKSYIVSLRNQQVNIKKLNKTITFRYDELIWTELSRKYSLDEIEELAVATGFSIRQNFLDCKHYFVDSLWEKE